MIYDNVFGTGIVQGRIQLPDAQVLAPQSALTVTCRRIHNEATALHQTAYATYWAKNTFQYTHLYTYDQPLLTKKQIKNTICVIQHENFGSGYKELEVRVYPGAGDMGLVLKHKTSKLVANGSVGYQIDIERRDRAWWQVSYVLFAVKD